ncbi:MAG: TRAP transporter small permease [Microbacterium sp.]
MVTEPDRGESIFGHTDTVFTAPELNAGAPREPLPLRVLSGIEMGACVLLFVAIVFGVMYQVLGRYVPAVSWIGSGELALLAMVSMTFLMIGYLAGRNGHVTIEMFDQLLRGRKLFVALRVVSAVIMLLTCLALAYDAFAKVDAEWSRSSAAIGIPMGLLYVFALVGGISAGIHSAWKIPYAHRPERQLEISEMEG